MPSETPFGNGKAVITGFWLNEVKTRRSGRQTDGSERRMCWHLKHARWERWFNGRETFSLPLLDTSYGVVTNDTVRNSYFLTHPIPKFVYVNGYACRFFLSHNSSFIFIYFKNIYIYIFHESHKTFRASQTRQT